MTAPINMARFREKITPVDKLDQAKLDFSLRLMLSAMLPPPIRNGRYADGRDVELAVNAIRQVSDLYADFVETVLANLNDGLPITEDLRELVAAVKDTRSDITALLDLAADRVNEVV